MAVNVDVDVIVAVDVIDHVIVAALVNRNDAVEVIDAVDDQGSVSFVSIVTMRSSNSLPRVPLFTLMGPRVELSVDQLVDSHDVEVRCGL